MAGANGKHWVMLVAGSMTWKNYRHQAGVCHAYQIVHQNGIPDDQIVVMMYDDIANNKENPYPGIIINEPNGQNVYQGVPKDYTGEDVTPENFLAALKGDKSAVTKTNPKVITSGGNDTIFVYLADHGGSGIFCFPNSRLHAHDLIETIKEMARNKKFSKMVIYMMSCKSGSMFNQLPDNVHVYAVSSATANQPSYACYFDRERKTYLSSEFTSLWMYYMTVNNLNCKTFRDQFSYLQEKMKKSQACRFGDMKMLEDPISGFVKKTPKEVQEKKSARGLLALTDLTPNHEVPLKILTHRIETETDASERQRLERKYEALLQTKAKIDETVQAIIQHFKDDLQAHNFLMDLSAYKTVAEHFRETCFDWEKKHTFTEFHIATSHLDVFARLCACGVEVERIKQVITTVQKRFDKHPTSTTFNRFCSYL